jgi:hypothetical protein
LDHVGTTAQVRKVPDVQVDMSEESVVTLVRAFSVVGIRHEVRVLAWSERTVDGKVLRVLTHYLLTRAVVHVAQLAIVGLLVSIVHLELFENDFQDGVLSEVHASASVFLRCPPIETVDDGSESIPRLPINSEESAQTCLIISVDLEGAGILGHQPVQAEAVRGTTWPACHSELSIGFFTILQIGDCVFKDCVIVAA